MKKPSLFLDNLSSPSDGGSQKNASENKNALNTQTSATSNGSGGGKYNQKDLNYLLNRDPMKEFFHLTLQSIRMNSPHMNQILNVDCDLFYSKVLELQIPFNKWTQWLEDQLNRIILSRMMKMSMFNKISENKVPSISVTKVEEDVQKMDSKSRLLIFN